VAELAGDMVALSEINTDIDGDQSVNHGLPAGFGDCEIIGAAVQVLSIATVVANPELLGVRFTLVNAQGGPLVMLGTEFWRRHSATALSARAPEQRQWVPMRESDQVNVSFSEVDTNVTPTADSRALLLVRRLRNIGL